MSTVLVVHAGDTSGDEVVGLARVFAELLGSDLDVVQVDDVDGIVEAAAAEDVEAVVIGARGADEVVGRLHCPVLVVPDGAGPSIRRALIPLEGSAESSEPVADTLERLHAAGVELVVLHVFDASTVPRFWDQSAHADASYASSFASRWCDQPAAALHLRRGAAPEVVADVARSEEVDLIALAWTQDLSPGRAAVVRAALAAEVPVLLVPRG